MMRKQSSRAKPAIFLLVAVVLARIANPGFAQSNYTPYAFTTLAGSIGNAGTNDGAGAAARFNWPYGIAADSVGNVYVADYFNNTIRKITAGGAVTTLAGKAGASGTADGTGSAARFDHPYGVAVDSAGNAYVTDSS